MYLIDPRGFTSAAVPFRCLFCCCLFASFVCGDCVFLFCNVVLSIRFSFAVIWIRKRVWLFTCIVLLLSCGCQSSVSVPYGAISWYVVCHCAFPSHTHF